MEPRGKSGSMVSAQEESENEEVMGSSDCEEERGRGAASSSYVPWSSEEDDRLRRLVEQHGARRWGAIAERMPNRNSKSCRLRWVNQLRDDLKKGSFTLEEDIAIIKGHARHGNRWTLISKSLPGRTDNAVKNRWHGTLRKRVQQQDEVRRQVLSAAHLAELAGQPEAAQLLRDFASRALEHPAADAAPMKALLDNIAEADAGHLQELLEGMAAGAAQPAPMAAANTVPVKTGPPSALSELAERARLSAWPADAVVAVPMRPHSMPMPQQQQHQDPVSMLQDMLQPYVQQQPAASGTAGVCRKLGGGRSAGYAGMGAEQAGMCSAAMPSLAKLLGAATMPPPTMLDNPAQVRPASMAASVDSSGRAESTCKQPAVQQAASASQPSHSAAACDGSTKSTKSLQSKRDPAPHGTTLRGMQDELAADGRVEHDTAVAAAASASTGTPGSPSPEAAPAAAAAAAAAAGCAPVSQPACPGSPSLLTTLLAPEHLVYLACLKHAKAQGLPAPAAGSMTASMVGTLCSLLPGAAGTAQAAMVQPPAPPAVPTATAVSGAPAPAARKGGKREHKESSPTEASSGVTHVTQKPKRARMPLPAVVEAVAPQPASIAAGSSDSAATRCTQQALSSLQQVLAPMARATPGTSADSTMSTKPTQCAPFTSDLGAAAAAVVAGLAPIKPAPGPIEVYVGAQAPQSSVPLQLLGGAAQVLNPQGMSLMGALAPSGGLGSSLLTQLASIGYQAVLAAHRQQQEHTMQQEHAAPQERVAQVKPQAPHQSLQAQMLQAYFQRVTAGQHSMAASQAARMAAPFHSNTSHMANAATVGSGERPLCDMLSGPAASHQLGQQQEEDAVVLHSAALLSTHPAATMLTAQEPCAQLPGMEPAGASLELPSEQQLSSLGAWDMEVDGFLAGVGPGVGMGTSMGMGMGAGMNMGMGTGMGMGLGTPLGSFNDLTMLLPDPSECKPWEPLTVAAAPAATARPYLPSVDDLSALLAPAPVPASPWPAAEAATTTARSQGAGTLSYGSTFSGWGAQMGHAPLGATSMLHEELVLAPPPPPIGTAAGAERRRQSPKKARKGHKPLSDACSHTIAALMSRPLSSSKRS